MATWYELLRQARDAAGLTRRALAERAGVAVDTIASYEYGRRRPNPETLRQLGRALNLSPARTAELLTSAGFHSDTQLPELERLRQRRPPPTSLAEAIADYAWPCLVLNERFELTAWNDPAVRDFATTTTTLRDRNLMAIAADPHFRQRAVNWESIVGHLVGLMKENLPSLAAAGDFSGYFNAVVGDIRSRFSGSLQDLMRLWMSTPALGDRRNLYYPVWRLRDGTTLRFNTLVTVWSDFDALYANDWHPADAATWEWLGSHEAQVSSHTGSAPSPFANEELGPPWFRFLRQARRSSSLSRARLASLAGVSTRALDNYEAGRRKPSREIFLRLTRAMQLDGATTNAILAAAGEEPEPSDWALFLTGLPPRTVPGHFGTTAPPPLPLPEIRQEIAPYPWPCLLVDAGCDIAGGNAAAARVLDLDVLSGVRDPRRRNLVRFVLSQAFRDRAVNWEEAVTAILPSTLQAILAGEQSSEAAHPLVAGLEQEEPGILAHLRGLWATAPPPVLTSRVVFPLVWRHADGTVLAFDVSVERWHGRGPHWLLDWHPADAVTWRWLGQP